MTVRTEAFRVMEDRGAVAVWWRYAMARHGGSQAQIIRCTLGDGSMETHPETPKHLAPEDALREMRRLEETFKGEHPAADMSKRDLPSYKNAVPLSECFNHCFDAGMRLKAEVAPMKALKFRPGASAPQQI